MSDPVKDDKGHVRLSRLGSFSRGRGGTKADERPHGIPCVRYGDLYTHHDTIIRNFASFISPESTGWYTSLRAGDLVFAASGETHEEIGKAAVYRGPGDAYAGADTIIFRPNPSADPTFLAHSVNTASSARFKARYGQGSSVIHISAQHLESLEVFCPPLPEQRQIAHILDTLDAAIQHTEALVAKLQQVKQGLLHDLLTRGVDEHGELRRPVEEAPELYWRSELGWVPRGWEVEGFERFASKERPFLKTGPFGSALKGEHWTEDGTPVITIGALGEGDFIKSELLFVSEQKAGQLAAYTVEPGDVVFSRVADVGRSVVVTESERGWIISSNLMWISLDKNRAVAEYTWLNLSSKRDLHRQIRQYVNAGGRDVANSNILRRLRVAWPTPAEQRRVVCVAAAFTKRIGAETTVLGKLRLLKRALTDDLLTGRVRVTSLLSESQEGRED